jgi:hypothetical protein
MTMDRTQPLRGRTAVHATLLRHAYPRASSSLSHYLGLAKQTVKGTGVVPTLFVPYQGSIDLSAGQDGDDVRQAGTGTYVNRTMKTKHDPSGAFGMAARPKTLAQLVAWFLGADASVASGSLWDHTATPAEANTWLTVEQAAGVSGDIIERYTDALLTSLSLSTDGNGDLMTQFGWMALTPGWQSTAATPTYETGVSGTSPGGPYRATEATYTVDGSAATNVQSWSVDLEWKLDDDIRLSKVTRADALKLELTGKVKIKQLLDAAAATEYRKIIYGSTSGTAAAKNFFQGGSWAVVFDNGLATTNQRTLSISCPVIDWKDAPYTALNPDGETMYIEREGVIRKDSGAFVTIVSKTSDAVAY